MKRLLVANRGEIAVRVIRACREAGVSPIAVYSEADRDALHVALADAAFPIGPGPAPESYLRIPVILEAARKAGADAIHPGYGFLSENADFAEACAGAGITFVGPPAAVIRRLGDKSAAKRLAAAAGVPVLPGYPHGGANAGGPSDARLQAAAARIGMPLLIKAVAGGGGRGMRVVRTLDTFPALRDEARREARAAFGGDDRLLLERFVERPRHIEFQIFGDGQGNVLHLFERECSIQRRHQKIVEESPSPALSPDLRARMAAAAVRVGRESGYVGAGTVEFLLDGSDFFFLEVNTRLQVEHPVTEMRTGLDLVGLQLRVARGELLPFVQDQVSAIGHAIEVRINAEDADRGFLPSAGRLRQWIEPAGPGIRVDSGVARGSDVPPFYDPLLAKLIAHGQTRSDALARLEQALGNLHALGVHTNTAFLRAIVEHPAFRAGDTSTRFLDDHFAQEEGTPLKAMRREDMPPRDVLLALAAEIVTRPVPAPGRGEGGSGGAPQDPWRSSGSWRNSR